MPKRGTYALPGCATRDRKPALNFRRKVLTANMYPTVADAVLKAHGMGRKTRYTITDPEKLQSEFEVIRGQGYAVNREEEVEDVSFVGAPIRDHRGKVVAALSVSMLASRMDPTSEHHLAAMVRETGNLVSAVLGYGLPPSSCRPGLSPWHE